MLLLILLIAAPVVLALAADGLFGYFVATRQILWVLPSVAVFAALGIERKSSRRTAGHRTARGVLHCVAEL